ncbi:sialic acid-binding Ig-like lectin 7 [Labeo rohita]|uniref:Sialic acid-binding Ig-like lectin 7 n=1 Tax=Labeo rohita TaxID=84645 RepID=A0A498LTI2_LABRO|nr:sialic acid-binding Ig-like lectin 7 [Labeo rohita]
MFISEERLSSTGLRSFITLHQSLTNTSTLQCVSKNTHGTASQLFHLLHVTPQESDCQQSTVLLLIILTLILVLFALTVGLGLYKMRQRGRWPRPRRDSDPGLVLTDRQNIPQISTAGDENDPVYANTAMLSPNGAATKKRKEPLYYASIDFTKMPPPESDEIRGVSSLTKDYAVVRCYPDAPMISPSSSCTRTDVPVCFCEADGNPSPELEWHLSGRPVTNSSNTFISEERLSSTGLRSFITLHQSLTHTSTLQCVSNNTHGAASQEFHLLHVTPQESDCQQSTVSFLIILTLILVLFALTVGLGLYKMRQRERWPRPRRDSDPGLILTDRQNIPQISTAGDENDPVYANTAMLSPNGAATQNRKEPLYYASIDFTKMPPPESDEIRGVSSLTKDYAVVRCYPDAPKISNLSSCSQTDATVCFCEVDGNPSPELRWHLSGRPVTNSSNTLISEERLCSTGLRSSITLHQSLTNTSTLQCVSNNTHGTASQLFLLFPCVTSLKLLSVLIEVAVGALVVMMMCVITYTCVRVSTGYSFILGHINTDSGSVRSDCWTWALQNETIDCKVEDAPKISNYSSCTTTDVPVCFCEADGNPSPKLRWHLSGRPVYAPKISPSSSCVRTDVTVCFCEVDGNPTPELEWRLSGRPVTNSSNTLISEERLSSTGLRSSITLHQSLTHTSTLQCVSNNTHGNASQLLELPSAVEHAPQISISSSCISGDVSVCFCEVDGNPSPKLEWHLSGRPVSNSSNTFISEERLSSTGLRSFITLHQSLTNTSTLQCVSKNTYGTASQLFLLDLTPLQFTGCQQATVLFLVILILILVLYALTVGLGLYKMRQLSAKLKAQNEGAGTYASLHLSAPPSEYETLNIKRDAPKISIFSSYISGDVPVCFCEADGNPSPKLEWHLSGRPVSNSSNTFISEERLSSTGLRSFITLHQSLTNTSTLQCVSKNTYGTASQLFLLDLTPLQFTGCQQATVLFLVILILILVLYALTVGLGLYKMRQLSAKLKAQNEGAGTYASLHLSAPPSEYETLNIKRDAPKISIFSSYISGDLPVCFCEADGNPSPKLECHLSGRPVTNSSNTFISEERLSSTGLRSSITLHQSLTNTSTLQCVSNNTHGTASQLFHLLPPVKCSNRLSVLIGVAVVALVVLMMCAITCIYAAPQEYQGDSAYVMMSSAEAATANQESAIYSSIDFTKPKPREVRSVSSLHAVHSIVQDSSTGESSRAREAQVTVSADVLTKQTQLKESEEELLVDSSQLYSQVKRRSP